ncbi:MAG: hypothetical protein AAF236_10290 [Verrucomicrobiota bacterium]
MKAIVTWIGIGVASFTLLALSTADEAEEEQGDPFSRKGSEADPRGAEGHPFLVLAVELIEVPRETIRSWEDAGVPPTQWWGKSFRDAGSGAEVVDSALVLSRSGARARCRSILKQQVPAKFEELEFDLEGPHFPVAFEPGFAGLVCECDATMMQDQLTVNLAVSLDWSQHLGENTEGRMVGPSAPESDLLRPVFARQRITTTTEVIVGEPELVGRFVSRLEERRESHDVLVFARVEQSEATGPRDRARLDGVSIVKVGAEWVDVPADAWHEALSEAPLADWITGGAWQWARELDGATVLSSPVVQSKSGARAKVDSVRQIEEEVSWARPTGPGAAPVLAETRTVDIGEIFEFDSVLSADGILDFFFRAESTSLHGYSVSYRVQRDGDWVPAVRFPRVYSVDATSSFSFSADGRYLVHVGTPPTPSGTPDESRKRLFFLSNRTFVD